MNSRPEGKPEIRSDYRMDSNYLHALKMQLSKSAGSKQLKIDSSAIPICLRYRNLSVYFVKTFEVEEGYVTNQRYIGFCVNDSTKQRSTELTLFSDEMIDLTDSTWHKAIRLVQEPRLALNDVDDNGWPSSS
jgi:hypothetical protein